MADRMKHILFKYWFIVLWACALVSWGVLALLFGLEDRWIFYFCATVLLVVGSFYTSLIVDFDATKGGLRVAIVTLTAVNAGIVILAIAVMMLCSKS